MRLSKNIKIFFGSTIALSIFVYYYFIETNTKEILFGTSVALSGPLQEIGIQYTNGINTYFKYINDNGGINGTKINFIIKDDQYEPLIAIENISSLIRNNKNLFAILGTVGTPTAEETIKYAVKSNTPYLMPFSGADFLYTNNYKNIYTLRPSYKDEAFEMVKYLLSNNIYDIAIFYQNDSYGLSALKGINEAIKGTSISILAEGIYNRNTISIYSALEEIRKTKPKAIIMAGAYKPSIEFINQAVKKGYDWEFLNFSFVGLEPLQNEIQNHKNKILVAQSIPPLSYRNKDSEEYQKLFKQYYPNMLPNSVAFEGFLVAKVVVNALQNTKNLTKQNFLNSLNNTNMTLFDNSILKYTNKNHNGLKTVYLLQVDKK